MIAALASVSFGFRYVQPMKEPTSFSGMADHHMSRSNNTRYNYNMFSHMNMTEHMGGNTYTGYENMHNRLNMTEHMQNIDKEGNVTAPHMQSRHGSCHD